LSTDSFLNGKSDLLHKRPALSSFLQATVAST
jgi:hypothetical protein